jgi:hypothetical protein
MISLFIVSLSENQNYKVLSDILILIYYGQLLSNPFQALVFLVSCASGRSIAQLFCNIIPAFVSVIISCMTPHARNRIKKEVTFDKKTIT